MHADIPLTVDRLSICSTSSFRVYIHLQCVNVIYILWTYIFIIIIYKLLTHIPYVSKVSQPKSNFAVLLKVKFYIKHLIFYLLKSNILPSSIKVNEGAFTFLSFRTQHFGSK